MSFTVHRIQFVQSFNLIYSVQLLIPKPYLNKVK